MQTQSVRIIYPSNQVRETYFENRAGSITQISSIAYRAEATEKQLGKLTAH